MTSTRYEQATGAVIVAVEDLDAAGEVLGAVCDVLPSRPTTGACRALRLAVQGIGAPIHRFWHHRVRAHEELNRLTVTVPQTPRTERPRCGARTRSGSSCQAPVVWDSELDEPRNGRCRRHGGMSTGPLNREAARERAHAAPRSGGRFSPRLRTAE